VTQAGLELSFLQDGAQPAERTAGELASFIGPAQQTLEIAIYDLNLVGPPADMVRDAIRGAAARKVAVRLIYNVDFAYPIPVPPPPENNDAYIASLGVPARPISGVPSLMHHKYVIRDAATPDGAVWTGSTNWTNDSWTREENVLLRLPSAALALEYRRNFEELWSTGRVDTSGRYDLAPQDVPYGGGNVRARVWFSPGRGRQIAHVFADRIGRARQRVRLCSPVITAGPILGTLAELNTRHPVDVKGVYDRTQMVEVLSQWRVDPHAAWKVPVFASLSGRLPLASKVTTPYAPGSVHDYMHAKITVVDDVVLTGSYNLSHSGEDNAENVVELKNAALADVFAQFVDRLFDRYGPPVALGQPPK
jgi:phosphatidylserine/phosphatidylglycerophosphate/cardiolipin synthase-like enzyme